MRNFMRIFWRIFRFRAYAGTPVISMSFIIAGVFAIGFADLLSGGKITIDLSAMVFVGMLGGAFFNLFSLAPLSKHPVETFLVSLPIRRVDIVLTRYAEILFLTLAGLAVVSVVNLTGPRPNQVHETGTVLITLWYYTLAFLVMTAPSCLCLPLYFRFGSTPAVIFANLYYIGTFFTAFRLDNKLDKLLLDSGSGLLLTMMGITILLWVVSVPLSIKLYRKRIL